MESFYEDNHLSYYRATVAIDPGPFLQPLAERLRPGATVLDVGCGAGRDLRWLAARGFDPTGFELSPGLAGLARDYSRRPVIEGDFTAYDFSRLEFDALLLTGALVHIEHPRLASVLLNIGGALRDRGIICISMKEGDGYSLGGDGRVFTLWRREQLEMVYRGLSFDVLSFSRLDSALNETDIWLSHILEKR